jgi:hypothetical protein
MTKEEAKRAVLREWPSWLRANPSDAPSGRDALLFYQHLEKTRPDLLSFRTPGDKWQIVHGWLSYARLVCD